MFSALVVLNLFGTDLILETIHLSVCWHFLNGLKPKSSQTNKAASPSSWLEQLPGCQGQPACGVEGSLLLEEPAVPFHFAGWFLTHSHLTNTAY